MKKKPVQKKETIPIHPLSQEDGHQRGIVIRRLTDVHTHTIHQKIAHRDDHYQFIFQEKGTCSLMVDFQEVTLKARQLLCILPGQVHRAIAAHRADTWILSVQSEWVSAAYQAVFDTFLLQATVVAPDQQKAALLMKAISFLDEIATVGRDFHFSAQLLQGAIASCLGIFAAACQQQETTADSTGTQPAMLLRQFKTLLSRSYKTMKSPAEYAKALHISPGYLNEVIKAKTGFPVSYWIQQEIITAAKRMLYYTEVTVKELADTLGYEDHSYFSRFFRKAAGMPPLQFRELSRE
jgi:AraC family transcriptional regulator, transcriptional activator of pobA